ncbi:hypothetical protein CRYUN_Cryun39dG0048400 [Craigia yunnanensis]
MTISESSSSPPSSPGSSSPTNPSIQMSGLWSPPVRRSVFLTSPGTICSQDEFFSKLNKTNEACRWNLPNIACFNVYTFLFSLATQ